MSNQEDEKAHGGGSSRDGHWSEPKSPSPTAIEEHSSGVRKDGDMLIVDWDGPNDPGNPRNWTMFKKWRSALIVSAFTFISPVSSSMIAPCAQQLAHEFHIANSAVLAMTTSVFVLAYAFGPLILGPLSEIYGRSRVLQLANMWYFAWNLACGFAQNQGELIAFRFLAGLGGSAPLSVGGGVLGDLFPPERRGQAVSIYSLAPLFGPIVGPIAGAWIGQQSTWRWVFYATTIADACVQLAGLVYLRETYAPVLLEWRAERIRKSQDIENRIEVRIVFSKEQSRDWKSVFSRAMTRPFMLFYYETIIKLLGLYMAFIYGTYYLFLTTLPSIFEGVYAQPVGFAGLNYIALGVGVTISSQINARMLDRVYRRLKAKNDGVGKPEFRLITVVPGTILLPIGMLITGWTARGSVYWIVPDIGIAIFGSGLIMTFQSIQAYIIDTFPLYAASALAAVNFMRSVCGFGFPLFAPAMYDALGYGKGDTILAVIAIAIGCPAPFLLWRYGERIRNASRYGKSGK
ncbi:MFS polyamine transporter [Amylostereum chailletii]|nr:MFS polyamine transporter [Amylostereum chailletii]